MRKPKPEDPPRSDPDDPDTRITKFRHGDEELLVISWKVVERPHSLTAAELAVAHLLAEGRTNAEIAAIRSTAVRTTANQVASVLAKLGVPSRRHVAHALRSA